MQTRNDSTNQTRITLKKVDVARNLSQETLAFTAEVYFDGVHIAHASNDGHGGQTRIQPYEGQYERTAEAAKYAEQFTWHYEGEDIPFKLYDLVDELAERMDALKRAKPKLKRLLSTKILALSADAKTILTWSAQPTAENLAAVKAKNPTVQILNGMEFEAALEIAAPFL